MLLTQKEQALSKGWTKSEKAAYGGNRRTKMITFYRFLELTWPTALKSPQNKIYFQVFNIAGPQLGTTDTAATTSGGAIGQCYKDTFTVASGGNFGSPIICGYNTGQHSK